jgi:predicted dehydrogenase
MEKVRVGIVGLGRAGWGMQCAELRRRPDKYVITAVCDLLEDRRAKAAQELGCTAYASIEDLVQAPNIDLVSIATRSYEHLPHAKIALASGKDVLMEKPLCRNAAEAEELRQAVAAASGTLYVRHNRRFEPTFQHIREIITSGILGIVHEIKLRRQHYSRRDDWQTLMEFGGGMLLNWGPHIVDHALLLLESPVANLWSDLKRVSAVGDAEDTLRIILRGTNGRIVDLQISGGSAIEEPTYLVFGERGALTSDERTIHLKYLDPSIPLEARTPNPNTPDASFGSPEKLCWIEETIPVQPTYPCSLDSIWDELHRTLREGVPFPITLEQALQVIEVISQAKEGTGFEQ